MDRYIEQKAMRDWVVGEGYNIFCTLKFKNGYDIYERQADRIVQLFLQKVDKIYFGNMASKRNMRCPRFVFMHKGKSGQNTHYHIVMQASGDSLIFLQILRKTWAGYFEADGRTSGFELARNTEATGTYCTHEWAKLGDRTFCVKHSHTSTNIGSKQGRNIQKLRRLLKALEG
jgi:hypothetical protein